MPDNIYDEFQNKLSGQMEGVFDLVLKERESHYKNSSLPKITDVNSIVFTYTNMNASISGGLNLIPGPLGLLTIVPEVVLIIRNQLAMICDLAYAYRGSKILTKETLLYVFGSALGTGGLGFAVIQGNKLLVKRVSLRVFQKIVGWLGGKITQRALKALIAKWFPIVGAAAMAAWTHYSTSQVAKKAIEIFSKYEINNIDSEVIDADVIKVDPLNHL